MGEHFYRYCQMIFLAWLTLFGLLVAFSLRSVNYSIALPEQKPEPLPTVVETVPTPPPPPPPVEPPVEKKPEYLVLARGNAAGNGNLGAPVASGDKKRIEIRVPYTGSLGEYRTFRVTEKNARSFDLMGKWKVDGIKKYVDLKNVPIRLMQLYEHDRYARLSIVFAGKGTDYLAEVRYTPEELIFCLAEPGTSDSQQSGDMAGDSGARSAEKPGKVSVEGKKPEKQARKKRAADKPADKNAARPADKDRPENKERPAEQAPEKGKDNAGENKAVEKKP